MVSFASATDSNFNCAACIKRNSQKVRDSKKGCNKATEKPVAKFYTEFSFYRCPGSLRKAWAFELMKLHGLYGRGVLPFTGGILDQSAKYVEAMQLIDGLMADHERELHEKAMKKAKARR